MALPLTIIGGYLGAGKTTLVNHLLRHADGLRLAVLVNEFGSLSIDADLIETQDKDIISIAGGCVCCSYGNDLTLALMDMTQLDPPPDHVLLEASGVALPGAIAGSVSLLQGYSLDGILTLCNAETIREQAEAPYIGDTITRQIADADLLILNKTDLIPEAEAGTVTDWLRRQGPRAEIVPAMHGIVPPAALLRSFMDRPRTLPERGTHHAPYRTLTLPIETPVDPEALAKALANPALGLVRAKGFVKGVEGTSHAIQVVGRRWDVSPAPGTPPHAIVTIAPTERFNEPALRTLIAEAAR